MLLPQRFYPRKSNLAELHNAALSVASGSPIDLDRLAAVGSSAGGARPKVVIWISATTGDLTGGADASDSAAWLVKFDDVRWRIPRRFQRRFRRGRRNRMALMATRHRYRRVPSAFRRRFAVWSA